jgi:hypothetical protein
MTVLALPLAAADAPSRPHRLMIDHDGHLLFSTLTTDFRADVDEEVRELPANVTTFLLCSGAGRVYYPTKVGLVDPNLKQLIAEHAKGNDPFGYFLGKLKAAGRETFVEFRMNDVHNPTEANHWNMPLVREQHPDVIARPEAAARGDPEWMNWSLDFSKPEAFAYVSAMLREVVEKYSPVMDGLQMDWMRFPRHLSGVGDEVWAKRAVLTRLVEQTRDLTKARGLKLAVRVPSTLRGCRVLGLDVEDWVKRGLVDFVVVSEFLDTDYTMPIAEFRAKFGPAMPIYASMEIEHGWQFHCAESLRAAATGLYDCGADGISLFNFVGRATFGAVPYDWLAGLESPATAAKKPLLYSLPVNKYRKEMDQPAVLPVSVPAHSTVTLAMPLPELALPAWRARLLIAADAPLAVVLNGRAVELVPTLHPTEMFAEFVPPANNFSNIGSHRPTREQSHFYRFEAAGLQAGANTLELRNDSDQAIEVRRVNLGLW